MKNPKMKEINIKNNLRYVTYSAVKHISEFNQALFTELFSFYIYAFSRRFYPKRLTVHSGYTLFLVHVFPGNWTHNLCAANAMLYHWDAVKTYFKEAKHVSVFF